MGENYHCADISMSSKQQQEQKPKLLPVKLFLKSHSFVGVIFV